MKYDVVIIGAGPGGLKCAEVLGKAGKKVLLLEKNKVIGPKICAGGLTRKAYQLLGCPDKIVEKSFNNIIFRSPKQRTSLEFGESFVYTVSRKKLGQWQLKKLKSLENVEVRTGEIVENVSRDYIETNKNEKIFFDKLVGADGAGSKVRRFLKLKNELVGLAFHYLLPTSKCPEFSDIEIIFDPKLFSAWYCWAFPHSDYVSIGFGCFPRVMKASEARKNLDIWLKKKKIDTENEEFQAFPINCDYQGYSFGNQKYLLVGEAAGLVSGFTGEGIYQALASGDDVARLILNKNHNPRKIKKIRREIGIHHLMLRIMLYSFSLKGAIFEVVVFATKSKFIARFLLRILT